MKRVYCLYRVSTLGQVEKDDIPMQRQACHAFAEKQGWQIIAEFSEKGVSGFKQSAEQREALVAIKQAAILKKFDVLLVFMFDRLGRRDDETPFVVEWFVKNGIAVWSVMEGEQRFENHVDKLLNYIRFWQSSGESIKTALRTRVRMEQLIQENGYVGGTAPYGYRLCKLGRVNKRGFEVHDLLMDPAKAEVIKTIFRLYCEEDMGPYRIAVHLTQQGELTRRGTQWNAASVRNILGNAIYTGIRTYGAIQTERFSHLQIVSDELYLCAQQKLQACRLEEPRPLRSQHWDAVLLKDRPYCMHCGKPVTVSRNRKSRRKRDGTVAVYDRMKYICINKNAFEPCTGQRNYSTRRIDQLILEAVGRMLFSDAFKIPSMDENSALSRCWQLAQELVYLMPSPQGYEFLSGIDQTCQPPTKRPYAQSPALRRRLEVGTILLTCIGAGIEPAFGKVEHLKRQPVFFPAFALRNAGGNLMNAAGCAGFGHWGSTAYMTLYVSAQNTGFVMTNELGHLHNLASVFSETLDTPQALILAGESYQSVYEVLTKKTLSKRHGKKGFVDYSEAYQKLSIPACIVSCDNTGVMQLAVMRQTDYRARIAQAAFGARWDSKDDGIPEADGHVDGNPLVIAVDMDLRRLDRVCTAAVRQGRKEIMVAALEGQMSGLLLSILPKNAPVRPLRINAQVLSVAFGGDCKTGDPWPDAPLTLKGGFVHV